MQHGRWTKAAFEVGKGDALSAVLAVFLYVERAS